jgi:ABC-2 type transport system permease protein
LTISTPFRPSPPSLVALPSTLPLEQSLILAWWQLISLVAATVTLFAAAYITFMPQEVRA